MLRLPFTYLIILSFFSIDCFAQLFPIKQYPQHYFQWPVGTNVGIVANFGELRPNHYHMGLDCRTDGRENLPIYAAADGYIAKIHIDATGFGRAIYINHPNGLTTLYAHLNEFNPALEAFIKEEQYKKKSWKIDVIVPKNVFKVLKGSFIAYSGNTGGSQGPHLHFEIRDTKTEKVLNPLLFGLPIEDNASPEIYKLSVYDRRFSTYEQTPKIISLKKINGQYQPIGGKILIQTNQVSFGINAFDKNNGSGNQNGIYKATLYDNEKEIVGFEMDSITYDETRYLNAHIDYKTRNNGGPFLQHLSILPGYLNGIYKSQKGEDGIISLEDNTPHHITIKVYDANENVSDLVFDIEFAGTDFTKTNNKKNSPEFIFKPGQINIFENEAISFYLLENSIYDYFQFHYNESIVMGSKIFSLHNENVPIENYFPIKIKGNYKRRDTGNIVMKLMTNQKEKFKKARFDNGWYTASFREFGKYELVIDTIAPVVKPIGSFRDGATITTLNKIIFSASDNTKEIAEFTGLIDGQWILFSNDKEASFIYTIDKYCTPGEHLLTIIVKDLVGNTTTKNYHFTR